MRRSSPLPVGDFGVRPISEVENVCTYCRQAHGEPHKSDCVIARRTVLVRLEIEYVTTIQDLETPEHAEDYWNEGTFCMDNALEHVQSLIADPDDPDDERFGCICHIAKLRYV